MKRILILLVVGVALFHCAGPKSTVRESDTTRPIESWSLDESLPLDPQISTGRLENGMVYFIRKNNKPENRAELRLVINVGSILESEAEQGLAHFTEHMAFNGTAHFEKQEIVDYLESIGMRFGPEINASTGFDETTYMLEVPTDSLEILEKAFQIFEDWAHGLSFEGEEIDKERGVIIEEWRLGRGAEARMLDKQLPILLKDSKYAERLPIGKIDILESFEHETLKEFYKTWYKPDLMALVAVGDFDVTHIEDLIRIYFSNLEKPESPTGRPEYPIPDHDETLFAMATDPEATQTRVSVYFKRPLLPETTVGDYKRMIIENIYDGILNERISELLKQADPPFLYAVAGSGRFVRTKGMYTVQAGVKEGGILRGLETLLIEAERVRRHGFTDTELDRMKADMQRGMEQALKEKDKTRSSRYASEYVRHFTEQEPVPGIEFESQLYQRFIPEISLEEINSLAAGTITDSNRVILISAPEKEESPLPSEEELLAVFDKVRAMPIEPYVDDVSDEPLVREIPKPGRIIKETRIDTLDVTEWRLANGVRVILKPTDFKNDQILFDSFSPGGTSLAPDSLYIACALASSVIRESGFGPFSQIELNKKLAGKAVRVSPAIGGLSEGLSGSASPQDIETLFELIYLMSTEPRADSSAFLGFQQRMKGYIENRSARPEAAYSDTIQVTMAQYHHRARPWSGELLDEMDLDVSLDFYRERFADASDFTFVFVGNFTPDSLSGLVETYLGGLPSIDRKETWIDLGIEPPDGKVEKVIRKGMEPKARVQISFTGETEYSREKAFLFNSMVSVLRIKLREEIREDKGGTYGVSVSGSLSRQPRESYDLTVSFGCNPERVDELSSSVFNQLDSLITLGVDKMVIEKVQETQRRNYETQLKENGFWLNLLYRSYYFDTDPLNVLNYLDLIESLSPESVQKTLQAYFDPDDYLKFVLLPEGEILEETEKK